MKKGWQTKKLSTLYQIGSSKRVLKSQWKTEGVPFYRGREVTRLAADGFVDNELFISEEHFAELSKQTGVPQTGDIVLTAIGTIGNSYVVRNRDRFYFKDASVLWMKRTAEVSSEFINLWLKSPYFFDQLDRGNGATVDTLTIQKLQNVEIDLPSLPEQKNIVKILDEVFEKTAKAKENAEKNLQNARELFESYLQSIFANPGKDWKTQSLGEVCKEIFAGGDVPKNSSSRIKTDKYKIPIFANGATNKGLYGYTDQARVSEPSITVSARGTIGYSEIRLEPYFPVVRLIVLIPSQEVVTLPFLKYVVGTINFKNSGTSIPQLTVPMIKEYKFCFPQIVDQNRIVAKLDCLSAEINTLETIYYQKLADLEELKKSVLHKAFNGELAGVCA